MAATLVGDSAFQDLDLGALFNSMAAGATVESGALAVPTLSGASGYPVAAELVLEGMGLVTTGAGSAWFQAVLLPESPGARYQEYGVSSSQLFPALGQGQMSPMASTGLTQIRLLLPYVPSVASQKLVAYNNLGNALAASVTATLRFWGGSIG